MKRILRQLELFFSGAVCEGSRSPARSEARHPRKHALSAGVSTRRLVGNSDSPSFASEAAQSGMRARRKARTSDEFLLAIWLNLRQEFFPHHPCIDEYTVTWSSRPQKRVLASCNIRRRRVVVAQELFEPSASRWIAPVLYHEMCHAAIGEDVHISQTGKRLWHGRQFRQLESRHPDIEAMNAWIATGGWAMAVRSHRARRAWLVRRTNR